MCHVYVTLHKSLPSCFPKHLYCVMVSEFLLPPSLLAHGVHTSFISYSNELKFLPPARTPEAGGGKQLSLCEPSLLSICAVLPVWGIRRVVCLIKI